MHSNFTGGGGRTVPYFVEKKTQMITKESIYQLVAEKIKDTENFIVDISINTNNQISLIIDSFEGISIDYCAELNKDIHAEFGEEMDDYELEVSSAGISEPFRIIKQYEKFKGKEVEVLSNSGLKSIGILTEVNPNNFTLSVTKKVKLPNAKRKQEIVEDIIFNYNEIKHTKYIIRF